MRHIIVSIAVLGLLLTFGCNRDKDEFIGPETVVAPEGFAIAGNTFDASDNNPDFTSVTVHFTAALSDRVSWKITISGLTSGAKKTINGVSDVIDATNSEWDGGSSNLYFFKQGEQAVAMLTVLGSDIVLYDTLTIAQVKLYNGQTINGIKYRVIDDFDGTGVSLESGTAGDFFDEDIILARETSIKVQGDNSFRMAGFDKNGNSWSGGINHQNLIELRSNNVIISKTDPEEVYVNIFVYGTGKASSAIQIKLYEVDDPGNLAAIPIPGYTYEQDKNDAWVVDIPVDWIGWKLVTKKYSAFTPAKDPASGGNGNKIKEPHKMTAMGVSLLSLPDPGMETEVLVDYVVVTEGGQFIP